VPDGAPSSFVVSTPPVFTVPVSFTIAVALPVIEAFEAVTV
jgi:hypothetical protein